MQFDLIEVTQIRTQAGHELVLGAIGVDFDLFAEIGDDGVFFATDHAEYMDIKMAQPRPEPVGPPRLGTFPAFGWLVDENSWAVLASGHGELLEIVFVAAHDFSLRGPQQDSEEPRHGDEVVHVERLIVNVDNARISAERINQILGRS
jgi:hypothetical protein